MKIIGYSLTYRAGVELARSLGYAFAYCLPSSQAPLRYTVMVKA